MRKVRRTCQQIADLLICRTFIETRFIRYMGVKRISYMGVKRISYMGVKRISYMGVKRISWDIIGDLLEVAGRIGDSSTDWSPCRSPLTCLQTISNISYSGLGQIAMFRLLNT